MAKKSLQRLLDAREFDPFRILGLHREGGGWALRIFLPYAASVAVEWRDGRLEPLQRVNAAGIFEWHGALDGAGDQPPAYVLHVVENGAERRQHDPYDFPPQPAADDLYLFNEGRNYQAYRLLGAWPQVRGGTDNVIGISGI